MGTFALCTERNREMKLNQEAVLTHHSHLKTHRFDSSFWYGLTLFEKNWNLIKYNQEAVLGHHSHFKNAPF